MGTATFGQRTEPRWNRREIAPDLEPARHLRLGQFRDASGLLGTAPGEREGHRGSGLLERGRRRAANMGWCPVHFGSRMRIFRGGVIGGAWRSEFRSVS
ncbi:MAG: hypothetical protein CMJ34_11580 [Phycisphaerae bacterium]|nr:hypothetical protein [Phycisphaerae bacterium]